MEHKKESISVSSFHGRLFAPDLDDLNMYIETTMQRNIEGQWDALIPKSTRSNKASSPQRIKRRNALTQSLLRNSSVQRTIALIRDHVCSLESLSFEEKKEIATLNCLYATQKVFNQIRKAADYEPDALARATYDECFSPLSLPQDNRSIMTEDRIQRRQDMLARLLSMSRKYSSCVAVTLIDDQLFVASNCSDSNEHSKVYRFLVEKLSVLKSFLVNISGHVCVETCEQTAQDLISTGGSLHSFDELIKSLIKLGSDHLRITLDSRDVMGVNTLALSTLHKITLLIPAYDDNLFYLAVYEGSIMSLERQRLAFPEQLSESLDFGIHSFHADQFIPYYLIQYKGRDLSKQQPNQIHLGLSQLSCASCFETLSEYPSIKIRGSSHIRYRNTANLLNTSSAEPRALTPERMTSPPRSAKKTCADFSPISPGMCPETTSTVVKYAGSVGTLFNRRFTENSVLSSSLSGAVSP